jgi:hypothetical protein
MQISRADSKYIVIIFDLECIVVEKGYPKQLPLSLPYKKKKSRTKFISTKIVIIYTIFWIGV